MKTARISMKSLAMGGCALGALIAAAAPAAGAEFAVEAQSLQPALQQFAAQGDQQVLFSSAAVAGKSTGGFTGEASPEDALQRLLSDTDLVWSKTPDGALLVMTQAEARVRRPQLAQAAGGGSGASTVEALIVTAQKREEDIQDVPIAISAFSQEDLTRSQIAGGPDLFTQIPNFTFTKTNFTGYSIQIRGIGTQAISATTDPAVAVAFNNTPFIRNRFFEQEFYDLQRIEVLRGPQGTLYGRNATAGVVNIISQKPKFIFEAKASADVSNYNSTRIEGMVNIPLVEDAVALRAAGAWTKRDGYAVNELTGRPIDGRDLWSTRLSLRVAPVDARFDLNLIWEHFEEDDDRLRSGKQLCHKDIVTSVGSVPVGPDTFMNNGGQEFAWVQPQGVFSQGCARGSLYSPDAFQTPNGVMLPYYGPLGGIGFPAVHDDPYVSATQSRDLRAIESVRDPDYRARSDLGELQISFDLTDNLTLQSETAYSTDTLYSMQDFNRFNTLPGAFGTQGGVLERGVVDENGVFCDPQLGCSDRLILVDVSSAKSRQFSQEFRLSSDFEGPFNFSLGTNFLRYDTEDKYYVFINSISLQAIRGHGLAGITWPYVPGVTDNAECLNQGAIANDPNRIYSVTDCMYVDPNPLESVNDLGHNYFLSRNPYKLISYAAFGEAYYEVTDALKITAGLRWTVDKKEAPRLPTQLLVPDGVGYPVAEVIEQEWREPTGRLAVDWKPDLAFTDETMIYASYAHGYKAGGANPPNFVRSTYGVAGLNQLLNVRSALRPKTFDAEFVDAFEIGSKNTLADGRVTLNLAAFYYDYKGYQVSEIVDRSAFNRNFDAEVWGAELEADWRPLENLKLGFKAGYQKTRIADGEQAIDLMDRTDGNRIGYVRDENGDLMLDGDGEPIPFHWVVVRPFPTQASSCILPDYLYHDPAQGDGLRGVGFPGGGHPGGCELAYLGGWDPVTELPYVANPMVTEGKSIVPGYPGFNPLEESYGHNFGEGLFKPLGGNELPNAPNWSFTGTVDYTVPLGSDWLATLHTDLRWQSESYWRIFNDHEYNKIDEYFTMNLAAIFTNEDAGWNVMAYVKNVFDSDAITGAFLLSDDTALVTNVFLVEPRLYGLRVTKAWSGGPLLGSFGERRDGPYPFTLELGGQVQRHDAPTTALAPSFMDQFSDAIDPLPDQDADLDWGDGREVKLTYQPDQAWRLSLGARFGKTNGGAPRSERKELAATFCDNFFEVCQPGGLIPPGGTTPEYDTPQERFAYTVSSVRDREEHTLVDFLVGREIGFGTLSKSLVSGGLRYGDLQSTTDAHIFGRTNWDYPLAKKYLDTFPPRYGGPFEHDRYEATFDADREFKGIGPVLSWEASLPLLENMGSGAFSLDWSLTGGVLFGERETTILGEGTSENFFSTTNPRNYESTNATPLPPIDIHRSENVTVPVLGASLGLSYNIDRFSMGAGYRWERYVDAIDGGFTEAKDEDRTIDGPYFKISVGFGGG